MTFNRRDGLALSFYVELTDDDKRHLDIAGVTRVVTGYTLALTRPAMLDYLSAKGKSIILRLDVPVGGLGASADIVRGLRAIQGHARVEALILGVEPENAFDMRFGSATWGNDSHMWDHRFQTQRLIHDLHAAGFGGPGQLRLVSPGFTNRLPNPSVMPYPGTMRWYIACQDVYALCGGSSLHVYTDNYHGPVDLERLQYSFVTQASMWEPPFFIDEISVNNGSEMDRTNGVLAFAEWLLQPAQQAPGGAGTLVECLCQFTANGSPGSAWRQGYLMTTDEPYHAIANWRAGTWRG